MATNDLQTNLDIIDDFTQRLQVAVIGAEETTAKHEKWVEGTVSETIQTVNGPIKTLRGIIAEWEQRSDATVNASITGYDAQFQAKLVDFENEFINYLLTVGFEPAIIYQPGITITRRPQTVAYQGVTYYWGGSLPYTTTGNFTTEPDWLIAQIIGGIEIPQMSFASGGTIVRKTQSVMGSDGEWYFWTGSFPKVVASGSTLESAGGVGVNKFKAASGSVPMRPLMKIVATAAGVVLNSGSFEYGATITSSSQVLAEFGTGKIWKWDGPIPKIVNANSTPANSGGTGLNLWNEITTATGTSGAGITISDNPPVGVGTGHRWYCTTDGRTYIRYADGDSVQWVEESPQNSVFDGLEPRVIASLRRSYAEAGFNLVDGSFENGGVLVNPEDVLVQESTGKVFSGSGVVSPGTDPTSGGFVEQSGKLLKDKLASSDGASQLGTTLQGKTTQDIIDAPYIITGSVNLSNPYWGAPTTGTGDPTAAAANHAAIQKMLNSGAKRCSIDSKPRYLTNTLIMDTRGQTFCGQGKDDEGLIFYGGDVPIISRADPTNINGLGKPGMRVEHMRIADRSTTRVNAWSINLTNGDSNGVDHIFLDGIAGLGATANYGVALGLTYGSTLLPSVAPTFVCHIRNSRLSLAKMILNTSDSYVEDNELWGNSRNFSAQIGAGGNLIRGNQIVPGSQAGILFKSQNNFLLNILRVTDNYFDGSYDSVVTGPGISCDPNSGVITSTFNDNVFWHINGIGASFSTFNDSEFKGIFEDCASADAANTPDLYVEAMSGSRIDCTHKRSVNAPKTGSARVNLSPPLQLVATIGAAVNYVKQNVTSPATYSDTQIGNSEYVVDEGKILNRSTNQTPVNGTTQIKNGIAYFCVGGVWKPFTT